MADEMDQMLSGLGTVVTTPEIKDENEKTTPVIDASAEVVPEPVAKTEEGQAKEATEPVSKEKTFDEIFKEKTGVDWEESYLEKIKSEPQKTEYEYKSDFAKKLDEYVASGGDENTFIETQTINFGSLEKNDDFGDLTMAEQIFYHKKISNPDMTDDMIEAEIRLEYGFDLWKDSPEDYDDGKEPASVSLQKQKFELAAKKARIENLKYQTKWSVPEKKEVDKGADLDAFNKQWTQFVGENTKGYNSETFAVGNDIKFDAKISDVKQIQSAMIDIVTSPEKFILDRYYDKKTNVTDHARLRRDMYILNNFESILKSAVDAARADGSINALKDVKNATPIKSENKSEGQGVSGINQLRDQLKNVLPI